MCGVARCSRHVIFALMNRWSLAIFAVLCFALPMQGALAATRLCMALAGGGDRAASVNSSAHGHEAAMVDRGQHVPDSAEFLDSDAAGMDHGGHAAGTCKLCSACCLSAAVAPPGLAISPGEPTGEDFRPVDVAVPPAIAGGFERPPRTM